MGKICAAGRNGPSGMNLEFPAIRPFHHGQRSPWLEKSDFPGDGRSIEGAKSRQIVAPDGAQVHTTPERIDRRTLEAPWLASIGHFSVEGE
jgi:hypothetical protein